MDKNSMRKSNKTGLKDVMMIGPDIRSKGGISSVIQDYMSSKLFEDCSVTYYSTFRDGNVMHKIWFFIKKIFTILLHINRFKIVHIHSSYGWSFRRLVIILWLAYISGKITILHIHSGQFVRSYRNASAFEQSIIRWAFRKTDIIVALSDTWKSELRSICPEARIEVIENAVDLSKVEMDLNRRAPSRPYHVLFMGKLGEQKGIYDIVEAALYLPKGIYHFTLAGDGAIAETKQIIREKGLQQMFEVPGWISGERKVELLKSADLFILPSYHEGLPMSILEAMAASLPIVAAAVGGIPAVVEDQGNGYLVSPGNPQELAKAIEQVFSEEGKWKRLSDRSLQIVRQKFNISTCKQKLEKLYNELLNS
jgi:glycosyltransferase involved in cell wall biosynthesis